MTDEAHEAGRIIQFPGEKATNNEESSTRENRLQKIAYTLEGCIPHFLATGAEEDVMMTDSLLKDHGKAPFDANDHQYTISLSRDEGVAVASALQLFLDYPPPSSEPVVGYIINGAEGPAYFVVRVQEAQGEDPAQTRITYTLTPFVGDIDAEDLELPGNVLRIKENLQQHSPSIQILSLRDADEEFAMAITFGGIVRVGQPGQILDFPSNKPKPQ